MISLFKQGLSFKPLFNQTIFIQIIDNLSKLNNTSKASYSGLADQFAGFTSYHNFQFFLFFYNFDRRVLLALRDSYSSVFNKIPARTDTLRICRQPKTPKKLNQNLMKLSTGMDTCAFYSAQFYLRIFGLFRIFFVLSFKCIN